MFSSPKRLEIDHRTIKLIIGLIALSLANLTSFFAQTPISSISASYYEGGWSQNIFVGFLFAISAFLLAYNGQATSEMVLSKLAACAALGVAMFPCKCGSHAEIIPNVHGISAATMFLILAFFCYIFFQRARDKGHSQAKLRAYIYAICGITIVASVLIIAIDNIFNGLISSKIVRLTFYGERTGLIAFGISWLTASRILPVITNKEERFSLFSDRALESSVETR
jgi:hypothetical protein